MSELRARQKALARQAILDALVALITERRHLDFSLQEVADGAGVSLRTVYNHFPNREALIDGLFAYFNELMVDAGGMMIDDVRSADELPLAVDKNFRIFEQFRDLQQAMSEVSGPRSAAAEDHDHRTEKMVALIQQAAPDVDPERMRPVALLMRHLVANHTWLTLTERYGLTTDQVITQVSWAFTTLLDAARRGDLQQGDAA